MFQTVDINIVPSGDMPVVNVSQYDVNRVIRFCLLNDGESYTPTNFLNAEFIIRKVDGTLFTQETTTLVSNVLELVTTEQMTACAGKNIGEIRITFNDPEIAEDDVIISTLNFILDVERSPETGGIESVSEIANLNTQIAAVVDEQLDNYYTKSEVDDQIEAIVAEQVTPIVGGIVAEQVPPIVEAELGNYYTKDETDTYFYNKTETDTLLSGKADVSDLPDMTDYYSKTETDTLLAGKVSNSTLNDYYTKIQVDNLIALVSTDFTTSIDTPASVQTFTDGGDNIPMKSCEVAIVAQQASGTPSPSNPLSITGFSSIDIMNDGKNRIPLTVANIKAVNTGTWTGNEITIANVKYTILTDTDGNVTGIKAHGQASSNSRFYISTDFTDSNNVILNGCPTGGSNSSYFLNVQGLGSDYGEGFSISSPNNCVISIYVMSGYNANNLEFEPMIRLASDNNTTFEPYRLSTTTTVSLGQTIYGGTAELVGGNGTKKYDISDLGDLSWSYDSTNRRFVALLTGAKLNGSSRAYTNPNSKCTDYEVIFTDREYTYNEMISGISSKNNVIWIYTASGQSYVNVKDTAYTNAPTFETAMTGVKFVYELETPTSFTFTGANIPTLSGTNNVYADSGDVNALEYFNDKADDIASMVRLITRS